MFVQINSYSNKVTLESLGALAPALRSAIAACPGEHEEEGGFITLLDGVYEFTRIRNANTGTPSAAGLYTADRHEYAARIIPKFNLGALNDSSFHTHPRGCRAMPSGIDVTKLFNGFPRNVIWSPSHQELNIFTFAGDTVNDTGDKVRVWDHTAILDYLYIPPEVQFGAWGVGYPSMAEQEEAYV